MAKPMHITARCFVDIIVTLLVGSVPAALNWSNLQPYQRGFYCDDESIRYPYHPDTVTSATLVAVSVLFTAGMILILEAVTHFYLRRQEFKRFHIFCIPIHPYAYDCGFFFFMFIFGALVNQAVSDIGKYSIGRMRPHFVSACQPSINVTSCITGQYLENFTCLETNAYKRLNARLSFPSGHASLSAYAMLYLACYVQVRFPHWNESILLKHLLQFVCLTLAWACGLSRVSDYKHHWSDVLVGFLIGSIVASLTVRYPANCFNEPSIPIEGDDVPESLVVTKERTSSTEHLSQNATLDHNAGRSNCSL